MDLDKLYAQAESNTTKLAEKQDTTYKRDPRILDMQKSKVVYFRMFPDATGETAMVHLHHKVYSFKSESTGKRVYGGVSPALWDKPDILREKQRDLFDQGQKEKAMLLYPTDKRLVNIFVIEDSSDESNNGQFKILNYTAKPEDPKRPRSGSPFIKFINKILNDEDSDIGMRQLYSMGEDGVTIKMTIKEGKDWPEFEFDAYSGKKVKGFNGFPDDKLMKIYTEKATSLMDMVDEPKSDEDILKFYNQHVLGVSSPNTTNGFGGADDIIDEDIVGESEADEIPMDYVKTETPKKEEVAVDEDDLDVDALLSSLDED